MSTKNYDSRYSLAKIIIVGILLLTTNQLFSQDDTTATGSTMGRLDLPDPTSIQNLYTYDPITERYILTRTLGNIDISYPVILTPEEYQELVMKEEMKAYFKEKIDAADGRKDGAEEAQKNLLPTFYVNSSFFESVFGGNTIEVIPQGTVEMDLGILYTKQDNPAFSPRNRSNLSFDFDQRISLSLLGKVGERLQVTANYDTQSTFDFQNIIKLEYTPTEDDIIQKIEVGNVSMPLNSSLIQGAQSLFGVRTELQFGKTTITGVFSEQRSETRSVVAEGGATVTEYELFALDYDENRHFFLSHYFRDNYDRVLEQYPFINSNVQVTRIEVWITNRNNTTNDVRNIVALQDIGESDISNIGLDNVPGGFINTSRNAFPDNGNNDFNPFGIDNASEQSILNSNIRDIAQVSNGFSGVSVADGIDYVTLENARRLQTNEYQLNSQLGYISLNQRLNNDEVLGVSFQFTVNGKVFQVGEFSTDGVDATGGPLGGQGGVDPDPDPDQNEVGIPQNLVVKLLKSNITIVEEPVWDIMMKNIYPIGAFQLEQEDFRMNILYTDPSPLNYITPAEGGDFPVEALPDDIDDEVLTDEVLLRLFNMDRLNFNNDPQDGGDGFFDFFPGITVDQQNGRIIFTSVEPFGEFLFDRLDAPGGGQDYDIPASYNANQAKYVYRSMYRSTKIVAEQEDSDKNKFQLRGTYKSTGSDGIPIGAFNIPPGSVTVTAGGRTLVEGVDYTVNYQLGRVQILDPALQNSNTPINISTENNTLFGQQTRRFTGFDVQHKFNNNFQLGGTFLNLNERPLTQKSAFDNEPINNTMFGMNLQYSTEVPFLTRLVNKLPNIDTDVPSNVAIRAEAAYLLPGAPKVSDFDGKTTSYIDDFEAAQTAIDISAPLTWTLSSVPNGFGRVSHNGQEEVPADDIGSNDRRALLNWYTIDPVFYSSQRPDGISDEDLSSPFTRRVFRDEIFPDQDIVQGQTQALFTLDLSYYPDERGPYNFRSTEQSLGNDQNELPNPDRNFGGIMRQLTTTDFERSNVEYIQFWLMDPFIYDENSTNQGGKLVFDLGNISEDILKDGRKQYENGLPEDGGTSNVLPTNLAKVPLNQSLIYTFSTTGQERTNQDVGLDGKSDLEEGSVLDINGAPVEPENSIVARFGPEDPARDNYQYFLQAEGGILDRYRLFNGTDGNSPEAVSNTDRGNNAQPDVEDVNRDNTMNTVDSYFQYEIDVVPGMNADNSQFVTDVKEIQITTQTNEEIPVRWIQFRIPLNEPTEAVNGISDFRSIRFMRMFVTEFEQPTVLRLGTVELFRGDYRRYAGSLDVANDLEPNENDNTTFENEAVGIIQNSNYVIPPGVFREELNQNNNIIRQDEQSLALRVCELEPGDARAVYKNFNVDMRQYKNLELFVHAEANEDAGIGLADDEMHAFIRLGTDLNTSFYEIEMPLKVSPNIENATDADAETVWPSENRLEFPLEALQELKSIAVSSGQDGLLPEDAAGVRYAAEGEINADPKFRFGIKGNPSFGNVRVIMIGLRNKTNSNICGEAWFNEMRLSELDNTGGWAAVANIDANLADFANVSATGSISTIGFGSIDQGPNQRSLEDTRLYDVVTNFNLGQLLPKKWGINLPFNYGIGEEFITPKFDPELQDIELDTRIDNETDENLKDAYKDQAVDYTKRQSINFIGVRKERTGDKKPMPYDIENFTFSYSYNQVDHNDFEIEESLDQNVRVGGTYDYSFPQKSIEPFKKNDSIFRSKYWQFLKDLNFNPLPSNISVSSNIIRQYNEQKFRELNLLPGNIGIPTLYQRNFLFDWQYAVNYNLTKSLRFNFNASNNRIVTNYINPEQQDDGSINYITDNSVGVWDGFFDIGDPNQHFQSLQINYDLPTQKFPFLKWIRATYSYQGDYQWQDGSDLFSNVVIPQETGDPIVYDLGNSIQNASTHRINSTFDMKNFYRYIGLTKIKKSTRRGRDARNSGGSGNERGGGDAGGGGGKDGGKGDSKNEESKASGSDKRTRIVQSNRNATQNAAGSSSSLSAGAKAANTLIGLVTMVKKVGINYQENNGIFLPGYTPSIGFAGTLKPTSGFVFGSQAEVRDLAARKGWLTLYPEFNEQYTEVESRQLDYQANIELIPDLKIDVNGNRAYSENYAENYIVEDGLYRSLTPTTFGNFNISTVLIKTAFGKSDENGSDAFTDFRNNRFTVADRLARNFAAENPGEYQYAIDEETGFPVGFGPTSQNVLLTSFLSAYKGSDASKEKTGLFRDMPLPNWDLKYTGLMNIKWFKKNFKRFSIQHGYRSSYTVNQFQTNLDYDRNDPTALDQAGNFKSETFLSNVNLTEQFSPLVRVDFEMQNSVKILAEYRKDRALSLSFANNLLTEIIGNELILGLGYRVKDLKIGTNFGGKKKIITSDLNFKLDMSVRDNKTIIRYLDINNNQVTAGQTIYGLQFSADYALSKNLTALFYYDHTFSEYAISTAFPQTTIRSGLTLRYNFGN
ncbi:T9SS outer membrane translocon Sov/SprA [Aureisphaera sp.]